MNMIKSVLKDLNLNFLFSSIRSNLVIFCLMCSVFVSAQVTVSITNASSVTANDGQAVAVTSSGSGIYTFYWRDLNYWDVEE